MTPDFLRTGMNYRHFVAATILLLCGAGTGMAQGVKNEVEVSIQPHQMPQKSLRLLAPVLAEARKARFYRETNGEQVSYESKLKWRWGAYSIEFHADGSLMDIEKLVSFGSLPVRVRTRIKKKLEKELKTSENSIRSCGHRFRSCNNRFRSCNT